MLALTRQQEKQLTRILKTEKGDKTMEQFLSTEFFKTLQEAETFKPCGVCFKEIYSLDKRGTVKKFREYQDEAFFYGRNEAYNARAVVVFMYR